MAPTIVLHYLEESRAQRVAWLLEELGLDYEIVYYTRNEDHRSGPELKKVHPLGHSPVLEIDGLKLIESGVIINYLISKYDKDGKFTVTSEADKLAVETALHHAEGSVQDDLLIMRITNKVRNANVSFMVKPVAKEVASKIDAGYPVPDLEVQLAYLEDLLAKNGSGYFVSDHLTGADFIYSYPLQLSRDYVNLLTEKKHPNLFKWLKSIEARPAYQAVGKKTKGLKGVF